MKRKLIDGHMHIAQWAGVFDMLTYYEESNGIAAVDNMCCSNNADLWPGFEADQTILGAIAKLKNPTVFTHGCLYIPKDLARLGEFNFKDQLDEMMELGLDGVKICDFKPDAYKLFHVGEQLEKYDEYIGYCEKLGVHMCWHVADPDVNWDPEKVSEEVKQRGWFYGDGSFPSYEQLIEMTYTFLESHPKLNLTLAHMFFKSQNPDEIEALLDKFPYLTLDFAPGWEMFNGFREHYEKWYRIFRKHSDRFIYATDLTFPTSPKLINAVPQTVLRFLETDDEFDFGARASLHGVKLEGEQLDNVLFKNHDRVVGEKPKEINRAALKKYIERYLPLIPDSQNHRLIEEYYKNELL